MYILYMCILGKLQIHQHVQQNLLGNKGIFKNDEKNSSAFLLMMAVFIFAVMADNFGTDFCARWYLSQQFTLSCTAVVIILPMCFPKKIDFLKYAR